MSRINPNLNNGNSILFAVVFSHADEIWGHVDDVVNAIRAAQIGCVVIHQPAARPDLASDRPALINRAAASVALVNATVVARLLKWWYRQQPTA
jgi:hypothetical protein